MGKSDKFSRCGGSDGSKCGGGGRRGMRLLGDGELPKTCSRGAVASEDYRVIVGHSDGGGVECNRTSCITKLAHGEQGGSGEVGNDVDVSGSWR
jgi:hypothetical protein